jgi:hypothetical protein
MAYGLQIFGPAGQTWFDSSSAQAGVPVAYVTVPAATYNSSTFTFSPGTFSQTYPGYSYFELQCTYLSNMFLEVTINSGVSVVNPTVSITNNGLAPATVLIIATASA